MICAVQVSLAILVHLRIEPEGGRAMKLGRRMVEDGERWRVALQMHERKL
jgi:hypothetical protein